MKRDRDQMREEYPGELIRSGVRGKFVERYRNGSNLVLIDPDLVEHFPDSAAVNKALRKYLASK